MTRWTAGDSLYQLVIAQGQLIMQKNLHFDDNRLCWRDEYSGEYQPPEAGYSEQFDLQWKLALAGRDGFCNHPGASVEDNYIDDRVYEPTRCHP